jgi:CubicO group peptidase (beta-lactamase class C family)
MGLEQWIWQGEVFDSFQSREIQVHFSKDQVQGIIDGVEGHLQEETNSIIIETDDFQFKGMFGREIEGFLRYAGLINSYVTPLTLMDRGSYYDGRATTIRSSLIFCLTFTDEEVLRAHLINQDRNQGIFYHIKKVELDHPHLRFIDDSDAVLTTGKFLDNGDIELVFPGFDTEQHVRFKRYARDSPPDTFVPKTSDYSYHIPQSSDDGLAVAHPDEVKMDLEKIDELVDGILSEQYPNIHGLLISKDSKLVLEEYFYGYHRSEPHDLRSAGKTLASILTGILIEQGFLSDEDTPIYEILSNYSSVDWSPRKRRITIKHLLTMTSGLHCNDFEEDSPGNEEIMYNQEEQDWVQFILSLPVINEPGEVGVYCTGGINVLGAVIEELTGLRTYEFAHKYLFKPLGIENYHFNLTPTGNGFLGGGIRLQLRDMLKLGQLYLQKGIWEGRRIVPENWVEKSWKVQSQIGERNYGYTWWHSSHRYKDKEYLTYGAEGNGGQYILVNPELNFVVLMSGGNYMRFPIWNAFREFIPRYILPAIVDMA